LFPGAGGQRPLDPASVQKACGQAALAAGLQKHVTPHVLRNVRSYYYTFQRMGYFRGNSCCLGSRRRSWRPCLTASISS
jgi:site-specific recombinase XerC